MNKVVITSAYIVYVSGLISSDQTGYVCQDLQPQSAQSCRKYQTN